MDLTPLIEWLGDNGAITLGGLMVGVIYGVAAQRSRFCLRAAAVEFGRGAIGPRTSVWLLCFGAALFWVQLLIATGAINLADARWVASPGSLSGAALGGLIFGAGMVLARGCPGRLLVLAASGNLRALLAGLVFAVAAQASLHGVVSPLRDRLAGLWVTAGPNPNVLEAIGFGPGLGLALGFAAAVAAIFFAFRAKVSIATLVFGSGVGVAAAFGWWFTATMASQSFEIIPIESLTFSGPTADVLMTVLTAPKEGGFNASLDFDIGLVPGVALGAAVAALLCGEWRWEGYNGAAPIRRALLGAGLMGFGAMLAGGCAIGAGVTGTSVMALTGWTALTAFWIGAMATDRLVDQPTEKTLAPQETSAAQSPL